MVSNAPPSTALNIPRLRQFVDTISLVGLFAFKLILHLVLSGRYGYHGDELYFIESGKHLAFGYVDNPPLVPWIARLSGELFGYSLLSIRFFPALAGALSVLLTVLIVREWGGNRLAQFIAGLAMIIAPAYLRMASLLSIPVFEPLYWTLCAYLIVRLIKRDEPKLWLLVGLIAGVGLLNKHTMLFWGLGIAVGLLLTQQRRYLKSPWLWGGGLLAFLIFLPNLIWQYQHEWATLQFIGNINDGMLAAIPRSLFLLGQLLYMHPFSIPIWLAGLLFFFSDMGKAYRLFGWMYLAALIVLLASHGKPYYLAPAYPVLFAGGAVMLGQVFEKTNFRWLAPVIIAGLIIGGLLTAPLALPILPLETSDRIISQLLGFVIDDPAMLTGEFHEQYGWQEQTEMIEKVYRNLSPEEQTHTVILTGKYNQASAINFFDNQDDLPPAVSGHMTYYLWGPNAAGSEVIIAYGLSLTKLESLCGEIIEAGKTYHPLAPDYNNDLPIYVCRFPKKSLSEAWPEFKRYYHLERVAENQNKQ